MTSSIDRLSSPDETTESIHLSGRRVLELIELSEALRDTPEPGDQVYDQN